MHGCQRCGRFDSSLRGTAFTYAVSLLVVTLRRPGSFGVFCSRCRKKEGFKYSLISGLLGWWGIPWGPIYTLQTIGQNSAGGLQSPELNADLLAAIGAEFAERGDRDEAVGALERSLELRDQPDVRNFLWALQGATLSDLERSTASDTERRPTLVDPPTPNGEPSNNLSPGDIVTWRVASQLCQQPSDDADVIAVLDPSEAIVTRLSGHWAHVRTVGGQDGWIRAQALHANQ
jgi:hypothetical protein